MARKLDEEGKKHINEEIIAINSNIETLFNTSDEEKKQIFGKLLSVYAIIYFESITAIEMIDYVKAELVERFLWYCLRKIIKQIGHSGGIFGKIEDKIFSDVGSLCYCLKTMDATLPPNGNKKFETDQSKVFKDYSNVDESLLQKIVFQSIFEKIEKEITFFPLLFRNLLENPDGTQLITDSQFKEDLNRYLYDFQKSIPLDPKIKDIAVGQADIFWKMIKKTLPTGSYKPATGKPPTLDSGSKQEANLKDELPQSFGRIFLI